LDERPAGPCRHAPAGRGHRLRSAPVARLAGAGHGLLTRVDQIVLPFRIIADGEKLPDLSGDRDPIILRARLEWDDTPAAPAAAPAQPEPDAPAGPPTREESERLLRIDPPAQPVYPEASLLGGFAAGRLGLNLLRSVARRMLSPEPVSPAAPSDATAESHSATVPSRPTEPIPLDQFHIAPRQIQNKFKHAKIFGTDGNWNPENGRKFAAAVREFVRGPDVLRIEGSFHQQGATIFFQLSTSRAIIFSRDGEFISGWTLSPIRRFHLLRDGRL
jgi:hypothetical protein